MFVSLRTYFRSDNEWSHEEPVVKQERANTLREANKRIDLLNSQIDILENENRKHRKKLEAERQGNKQLRERVKTQDDRLQVLSRERDNANSQLVRFCDSLQPLKHLVTDMTIVQNELKNRKRRRPLEVPMKKPTVEGSVSSFQSFSSYNPPVSPTSVQTDHFFDSSIRQSDNFVS